MEYASYLAGLDWSDHPDCTHPLLALVAREVNDETSDAARADLVPMIPEVIGVTSDDPRLVPALVARCVRLVVPAISGRFQRTLVAGLLTAEYVLAELDGRPAGKVRDESARLLVELPDAVAWATKVLMSRARPYSFGYEREAPLVVAGTIRAVTDFRVREGDALLRRLLSEAIEESRLWMPTGVESVVKVPDREPGATDNLHDPAQQAAECHRGY
ncbi:hypothetical protein E1218_25825 [Kribbella turkmenica]|uniref:Uncharacterized protein n=1 Tax=Kribbella turkmenica TaxID=2530375 RepID=A0A4R4WNJ5_9ACTN|nr:hypothetical protein [Kribbella turkmenica]TDD18524.1 hypothetical protein E1218_25825 [Kribbella turkmenica]